MTGESSTTTVTSKTAADNSIHSNNGDECDGDARFARFVIRSACIFYRSLLSVSFVNLRPIVPGHVLVMPKRRAPFLRDLDTSEHDDLWRTVRATQRILRAAHPRCAGFNVAVQDGPSAGQSVPHVHVHVLPRSGGDLERNDDIYEALELWAPRPQQQRPAAEAETASSSSSTPPPPSRRLAVADDDQRRDRTMEEMGQEAALYRAVVDRQEHL
jgi:bis(5'-adenosyl)-triphosphatase